MSQFLRDLFDGTYATGWRRAVGRGAGWFRPVRSDRRATTSVEYAVVIGTMGLGISAGFATLALRLKEKVETLPL